VIELLQDLFEEVEDAVLVFAAQVVAGAEQPGDGAGALEGEADVAGIVDGVEGLGIGTGGGASEEHAQQSAEGDAGDGNLGVEGGIGGIVAEPGQFLGVEDLGVESVDEAVLVAGRGADASKTLPDAGCAWEPAAVGGAAGRVPAPCGR
jgi:hypothetical protein